MYIRIKLYIKLNLYGTLLISNIKRFAWYESKFGGCAQELPPITNNKHSKGANHEAPPAPAPNNTATNNGTTNTIDKKTISAPIAVT
jgi:hypothetical protein